VKIAPLHWIGAGKPGAVEELGQRMLGDVTELTHGGGSLWCCRNLSRYWRVEKHYRFFQPHSS
jgi:hypothetical protein